VVVVAAAAVCAKTQSSLNQHVRLKHRDK